jgi:hypothetical protein
MMKYEAFKPKDSKDIKFQRFRDSQKVKLPCAQLIKHYAMKTYGGVDV